MTMSGPNLPKSILTPPPQDDKSDKNSANTLKAVRFHEIVSTITTQNAEDIHQNRMKNLRKELEYLKETEWKYEPIEKYIGQ